MTITGEDGPQRVLQRGLTSTSVATYVEDMIMSDVDLSRLRAAVGEVNRAQTRRDRLVQTLRDRGATWTELGYALGVSAQAAQKKYGTGSERHEAHKEAAAARALKRREKAKSARVSEG